MHVSPPISYNFLLITLVGILCESCVNLSSQWTVLNHMTIASISLNYENLDSPSSDSPINPMSRLPSMKASALIDFMQYILPENIIITLKRPKWKYLTLIERHQSIQQIESSASGGLSQNQQQQLGQMSFPALSVTQSYEFQVL